ncbi:unnamed protein product [Acanthosepion pharaonis]|uniref:Uncharacterized protein n=1 Tax=Acanthosepion pharaonis TaxID=158019 RepID=A0A812DI81_ACAPH|nr:unnamed protein product [Sepia pharaonis]
MAISVLLSPAHFTASMPAWATPCDRPARRPAHDCSTRGYRAAGDDVPRHRPAQRAEDDGGRDDALVDQALADRLGHRMQAGKGDGQEIGREVEEGGEHHGRDRRQQAGRHHGRDRIGRVMQAVEIIERQRDRGSGRPAGERRVRAWPPPQA